MARLDLVLARRGLVPSRESARRAILEGRVRVAGIAARKPSESVDDEAALEVLPAPEEYVSRGGLKLAHALRCFGIEVRGRTCLDVGTSTGGFADCLLRQGAARVFGMDVGKGQLSPVLHGEERLILFEETNVREASCALIFGTETSPADLATVDVSFISLRLVLPSLAKLLASPADLVALVKPQFEVGRGGIGKGGIVRDQGLVVESTLAVLAEAGRWGLRTRGFTRSPIAGGDGNREYLAHFSSCESVVPIQDLPSLVGEVVLGR